jgi:hypothetical protein
MIPEYLYRFDDMHYTTGVRVEKRKFKVIKETPCGYWIKLFDCFDDKKWVSKTGKKRYAYPTEEEALTSFKARKRRQIEILESQLTRARVALQAVRSETGRGREWFIL